jgi:surface antigen
MKVAKIADLENLADGTIIGEMVVQVKAAFDAKTGQGKYGPWRVQPVILKDATGEVRASFWTQDNLKDLTGQTITIKSQAGAKGLQGVKVKLSTHSGKNELDVSDKAAIIDGTRNALEQYTDAVKVNSQLAQSKGTVTDAKRLLFQKAQLYVECVKAAEWITTKHTLTQDHFQAVVSTLFISADKQNLAACFPVEQVKATPQRVTADEIPMNFEEADAAAKPKKKDEFEEEAGW